MSKSSDPYVVLGVDASATDQEIRAAYRALLKKHHPDVNAGTSEAHAATKQIVESYDRLRRVAPPVPPLSTAPPASLAPYPTNFFAALVEEEHPKAPSRRLWRLIAEAADIWLDEQMRMSPLRLVQRLWAQVIGSRHLCPLPSARR